MLHLKIKRRGEEAGQPRAREHNVDAIGPDFDPAEQRHEQRFEFIWRLTCQFLGDLTAPFDQLALLGAGVRVTRDGIKDCSATWRSPGLSNCRPGSAVHGNDFFSPR